MTPFGWRTLEQAFWLWRRSQGREPEGLMSGVEEKEPRVVPEEEAAFPRAR